MSVEFTYVPPNICSQPHHLSSAYLDAGTILPVERAFKQLLVDGPAGILTNMDIAAEIAAATSTIGIALTHWSGVIQPIVAARQLAALDRISNGRLSLRFLVGPDGRENFFEEGRSHVESLRQTGEYLVLLKRLWSNEQPFDYEGPHYSVRSGYVVTKGPQGADIPVRMGSLSGIALDVVGRHATVFELPAAPPGEICGMMERVGAAAMRYGRAGKIRFALPVHLDFGGTGDPAPAGCIHLAGSPALITRKLLSFASLGISEFMVNSLGDCETLDRFVSEVAPVFDRTVPIGAARRDARPFGGSRSWAS